MGKRRRDESGLAAATAASGTTAGSAADGSAAGGPDSGSGDVAQRKGKKKSKNKGAHQRADDKKRAENGQGGR